MTEIEKVLRNFNLAFEQYGRPKGPFEVGREHTYNATATAKTGPPVDKRHAEPPAQMVKPLWWPPF